MIIVKLMDMVYALLDILLVFEIPPMPAEVTQYLDTFTDYLATGAGVVANYIPLPYAMTLFGVTLAIDAGFMLYHFVMWLVKKIPMLGIE